MGLFLPSGDYKLKYGLISAKIWLSVSWTLRPQCNTKLHEVFYIYTHRKKKFCRLKSQIHIATCSYLAQNSPSYGFDPPGGRTRSKIYLTVQEGCSPVALLHAGLRMWTFPPLSAGIWILKYSFVELVHTKNHKQIW